PRASGPAIGPGSLPLQRRMTPGRLDVPQRWTGPMVVLGILGAVVLILVLNLKGWNASGPKPAREAASPTGSAPGPAPAPPATGPARRLADFREYPIGDDVEKNHMRIAAVWLPPVQMDGMPRPTSSAMIRLEAD